MTDPHAQFHGDDGAEAGAPSAKWSPPDAPLLWRGAGLGLLALVLLRLAIGSLRASWLLAPLAAVFAGGGLLAAWGSAIQLSGGTRHDDHPWI